MLNAGQHHLNLLPNKFVADLEQVPTYHVRNVNELARQLFCSEKVERT